MKIMLAEKYAGATVIRDNADGIVIRNSVGALEKVSESMAHQYNSGSDMRAKQQHTAELATKAKELNRQENQIIAQRKADDIAAISAGVARQRAQRDNEHDAFSNFSV